MAIGTGKLKALISKAFKKMLFGGNKYENKTHKPNELAIQNGWLGKAIVPTTDPISPVLRGSPVYIYDGTIGTNSAVTSQLMYGQRYKLGEGGFVDGYRVYTITGNDYSVYTRNVDTGEISQLLTFVAESTGWLEATLTPRIVTTASEFDLIVIVKEPSPTPVITTLSYDYSTPNNPATPLNGQITHPNRALGVMSISKNDQNGDESIFLATLNVGDIIRGAGLSWSIQAAPSDKGSYYDFIVAPAQQGQPNGIQDFDFETKVATPITYAEDTGYWLGSTVVRGLFTSTGGISDLLEDDNQYGVDLLFQYADISADWLRLSYDPVLNVEDSDDVGIQVLSQKPLTVHSLAPTITNARYGIGPAVYKINQNINLSGDYDIELSFDASCSAINRSIMVGLYIDGVLVDEIYNQEPKDNSNVFWAYKTLPYTFDGFALLQVQIGKGNGGGGAQVNVRNMRFKATKQ